MTDAEQLAYMGVDAQKWAQEWCKVAVDLGNQGHEVVDEGWMIGWFANAIEAGRAAGKSEDAQKQAEPEDETPTHIFEPYDANPTICRHCGAVKPMPCYRIKVS